MPQAEFLSALRLRNGFPAVTRPPSTMRSGAVPVGQRPISRVVSSNRIRYRQLSFQYNFNIQREVATETIVEVGYMANVSHHLTSNDLTLNQVAPDKMGPGDAQARRPFPQFSNVTWINPSIGDSTYHSGYVRLERRFHQGVSLSGALYVFEIHRRRCRRR